MDTLNDSPEHAHYCPWSRAAGSCSEISPPSSAMSPMIVNHHNVQPVFDVLCDDTGPRSRRRGGGHSQSARGVRPATAFGCAHTCDGSRPCVACWTVSIGWKRRSSKLPREASRHGACKVSGVVSTSLSALALAFSSAIVLVYLFDGHEFPVMDRSVRNCHERRGALCGVV